MSELEYRTAEVVEVSFPKRTIELIVMPYEKPTVVPYRGRYVTEVCSRGAYDGIEQRKDVKVNLHHDIEQTCGRATAFHPSRAEGLVAELYLSRSARGQDALHDADDGLLGGSAAFALLVDENGTVYPDAEVWETRDMRRLNKLYLGHIALTPEPAYKDAEVLAVRKTVAVPAMPNREKLEVERLREEYAILDARYAVRQH
jgi:phage head maturation protease